MGYEPIGSVRFTVDDPRIEMIPEAGCWLWVGYVHPATGYGWAPMKGRSSLAHRRVYETVRGPIPDGMTLDHRCRVRSCVNPDHLRVCTHRENILAPGSLGASAINSRKTNCPWCERPYTKVNRDGGRVCGPCHREKSNRYRRERYARDPEFRARRLSGRRVGQ